ncbi:MAG: hypothetical protein WBP45_13735 [Daejeonella sp.]
MKNFIKTRIFKNLLPTGLVIVLSATSALCENINVFDSDMSNKAGYNAGNVQTGFFIVIVLLIIFSVFVPFFERKKAK